MKERAAVTPSAPPREAKGRPPPLDVSRPTPMVSPRAKRVSSAAATPPPGAAAPLPPPSPVSARDFPARDGRAPPLSERRARELLELVSEQQAHHFRLQAELDEVRLLGRDLVERLRGSEHRERILALQRGMRVVKYFFTASTESKKRWSRRWLRMSPDLRRLEWARSSSFRNAHGVPLSSVCGVLFGKESQLFRRLAGLKPFATHRDSLAHLPSYCCFSVVTVSRTYDFSLCPATDDSRDLSDALREPVFTWVLGVQSLMTESMRFFSWTRCALLSRRGRMKVRDIARSRGSPAHLLIRHQMRIHQRQAAKEELRQRRSLIRDLLAGERRGERDGGGAAAAQAARYPEPEECVRPTLRLRGAHGAAGKRTATARAAAKAREAGEAPQEGQGTERAMMLRALELRKGGDAPPSPGSVGSAADSSDDGGRVAAPRRARTVSVPRRSRVSRHGSRGSRARSVASHSSSNPAVVAVKQARAFFLSMVDYRASMAEQTGVVDEEREAMRRRAAATATPVAAVLASSSPSGATSPLTLAASLARQGSWGGGAAPAPSTGEPASILEEDEDGVEEEEDADEDEEKEEEKDGELDAGNDVAEAARPPDPASLMRKLREMRSE